MHVILKAVVHAKDKEGALAAAKSVFDNICGEGKYFDYYVLFVQRGYVVAGIDQWGDIPAAVKASSLEGKALLEVTLKQQRGAFDYHLEHIKKLLSYKGEELFENCDFRYHAGCLGERVSADTLLYGQWGSPLACEADLNFELQETEEGEAWIVPVDAHF